MKITRIIIKHKFGSGFAYRTGMQGLEIAIGAWAAFYNSFKQNKITYEIKHEEK